MKIRIEIGVSQRTTTETITLDDLGLDQQEWDALPEIKKQSIIRDWVENMEQPYWVMDGFEII